MPETGKPAMDLPPEQVIREYLDDNGGSAEVPFRHLLASWGLTHAAEGQRDGIQAALKEAGVQVDPPFDRVGRDDPVTLYVAEAAQAPAPPAAWYEDPEGSGQLRYWDGARWTSHVHRPPGQAAPSEAPPAPSEATVERPKRPWLRRPALVFAALLVLVVLGAAIASRIADVGPGGAGSGEATESRTPRVGPNGTVTVDGLVYSIRSARTARLLGDPKLGTDEKADGVFVVAKVNVKSTKRESVTLTDETIKLETSKLETSKGRRYSVDTEGATAALFTRGADAKPFLLEQIEPGTGATGTVVFDVLRSALGKDPALRFNELGAGKRHAFIELPSL
jgi:uncharacterized protein DUF2510/uncharacterized protein DUF4352